MEAYSASQCIPTIYSVGFLVRFSTNHWYLCHNILCGQFMYDDWHKQRRHQWIHSNAFHQYHTICIHHYECDVGYGILVTSVIEYFFHWQHTNLLFGHRYSKHHGRRKLLHVSGLGMSVSALLVALCLHGDANKIVILAGVLAYVGFGSLGVITIPWTLVFELLPTEVSYTTHISHSNSSLFNKRKIK